MTRKDKLLKRFLRNPQALKYREIETILLDLGFSKRQGKGSHVKFRYLLLDLNIVIPLHHNDCKPHYKIRTANILKNNYFSYEA